MSQSINEEGIKNVLLSIRNSKDPYSPFKFAIRLKYTRFGVNGSDDQRSYSLDIYANRILIDQKIENKVKELKKEYPSSNPTHVKLYNQEYIKFFNTTINQEKEKYINKINELLQLSNKNNISNKRQQRLQVQSPTKVNNNNNYNNNNSINNKIQSPDSKISYVDYKHLIQLKFPKYNVNGSKDKKEYDKDLVEFQGSRELVISSKETNSNININLYCEFKLSLRLKYPKFNVKSKDQTKYIRELSKFKKQLISDSLKNDNINIKKILLQKKYPDFRVNGSKDNIAYSSECLKFVFEKKRELSGLIKIERQREMKERKRQRNPSTSSTPMQILNPINFDSKIISNSSSVSIISTIISYLPEDIALFGCDLEEIPKHFNSHHHYLRIFKPILFEELKAQISKAFVTFGGKMNEKSKLIDLTKLTTYHLEVSNPKQDVDNRFTIEFSQKVACQKHSPLLSLSDLVLIRISNSNRFYHIMGTINTISNLYNKNTRKQRDYIHGTILLKRTNQNQEIISLFESFSDIKKLNIQVRIIDNLTTFIREFKALECIDLYDHFSFFLNPSESQLKSIRQKSGSYEIPPLLLKNLNLNNSQLLAIKESLYKSGLNLIQGPPGTGKTTVIISLISVFLSTIPNCKIVVAAPSHTAVDEVARRILKNGLFNANGIKFAPKMVRTGRIEYISKDVHEIAMDLDPFITKEERKNRIQSSQIILTTLAGSGSPLIFDNISPNVIIVDECTQSNETASIIPFSLSKKIVLIGDPNQLPPTIMSSICKRYNFDRSLFERLSFKIPRSLLDVQYRMHPVISKFPSDQFYFGAIKDGENVQTYKKSFYNDPKYKALNFFDIIDSQEKMVNKSIKNPLEIKMVFTLIKKLVQDYPDTKSMSWGIITPYKLQKKEIDEAKKNFNEAIDLQINTVDGFQGGEKDIIIFSCVRQSNIGFLGDVRRINVGITRAKYGFFIIGNLNLLQKDKNWRDYINYIHKSNSSFNRISENGIISMEKEVKQFDLENPEGLIKITYDDEKDDIYEDEDEIFLKVPYNHEFGDEYEENDDDSGDEDEDEIIDQMVSLTRLESTKDFTTSSPKTVLNYRNYLSKFDNSNIINMKFSNDFNSFLANLYQNNIISQSNINLKLNNFKKLQDLLLKDSSTTSVEIFGSSLHHISTNSSDIDVCLFTLNENIDRTALYLKNSGYLVNSIIRSAKVPIIKFTDSDKLSYDLSFNRTNGILNSYLMKHYSLIDNRSKQLMLLIKYWAKKKNLNDASQNTLSSYAYLNMVIHYLQVIQPPVLPNLQENGKFSTFKELKDENLIKKLSFDSKNKLQISQLFYGFFYYYSRFDFKNQLISIRLGNPTPIRMASQEFQSLYSKKSICIEDPLDINFNIGKVVSKSKFKSVIYEICKTEYQIINLKNFQELFNL